METKTQFYSDLEELKLKRNKVVAIGKKRIKLMISMEDMFEQ